MKLEKSGSLTPHHICLLILFIFESILMCRVCGPVPLFAVLVVLLLSLRLFRRFFIFVSETDAPASEKGSRSRRPILAVLRALLTLYALWAAGTCALEFARFAGKIILPDTALLIILIPFTALCVWLAAKPPTVTLKISAIAFPMVAAGALILFALSVPRFNLGFLKDAFQTGTDGFFGDQSLSAGNIFITLPAALLFLSSTRDGGDGNDKKNTLPGLYLGVLSGVLLFALCAMQILLVFGSEYAATLDSPYILAVSVISTDDFFLRADGLIYVMLFMCSLIKTSVCLYAAGALGGSYGKRFGRCILVLGGIAINAAAFFM